MQSPAHAEREGADDKRTLQSLRVLAEDVGGKWIEVDGGDPAATVVEVASEHPITQIAVAPSSASAGARSRGDRW